MPIAPRYFAPQLISRRQERREGERERERERGVGMEINVDFFPPRRHSLIRQTPNKRLTAHWLDVAAGFAVQAAIKLRLAGSGRADNCTAGFLSTR